jgi:chemotaxis protein methyltransferase CheR
MHLRALILNEGESSCNFLSGLLTAEGHTPVCASGLREAQRSAVMMHPDLIILEVCRPDSGALETLQRLKRIEETRHTPVIVISDHPELEYEFLNVFDFMPKPVDVRRLREDFATLLQGRRKRSSPLTLEPLTGEDYQLFHDYLIAHSGLHFERRNQKILERGLAARMTALRIGTWREYFDYLTGSRDNRQELQKLLPFLTVGETYFFRYHAHFDALKNILAARRSDPRQKKIRLWSAGCSTGEEPYSMAITVMETFPDWRERDIRVIATDIDNRALKKAREGVYGSWAMRVMEKSRLDRYFTRIGKSYLIAEEVKSLVDFSHLNLQTDEFPLPDGESGGVDVIFCRNVMIYFSLATTRHVVEKISSALLPGGYLFLGHSETLFQISSGFERHSHAGSFYYREKKRRIVPLRREQEPLPTAARQTKTVKSSPLPAIPPPGKPEVSKEPPVRIAPRAEPGPEELFRKAEALFEAEEFRKAAELLEAVIRKKPDHTGALVIQGFIMANNGRFREALSLCTRALAIDDLLPEAYFLKGLLLDMNDRTAEAVEEYRKTILLRMDFVMPHYHLGRLYYRLGKEAEGVRELRNTLKILERSRQGCIIPFSGGLSREMFLQQVQGELAKVA